MLVWFALDALWEPSTSLVGVSGFIVGFLWESNMMFVGCPRVFIGCSLEYSRCPMGLLLDSCTLLYWIPMGCLWDSSSFIVGFWSVFYRVPIRFV